MILSDVYFILQWWLVLFILGIAFLPLTSILFQKFFDKGYIFAKTIGLALTGYTVFLFGVLHIALFTTLTAYATLIFVAVTAFFFLPHKKKLLLILKKHAVIFLLQEVFFLVFLFFWAFIHSFSPDIHGLEKYMDFGFINSFLRSDYLPAKDMWLTPFYINYYYFGHFLTALLIKLSNVPSYIGFNIMLSTIFAFCFSQTFSLGANLYLHLRKNGTVSKVKLFLAGILTASLVTLAGNLHIIYAFFRPYKNEGPVPFWDLKFTPFSFPNSYWYPNATRFIYNTIHEFPIYSWVVADLHGHVLDIPYVILIISLLFSFFISSSETETHSEHHHAIHKLKHIGLITYLKNLPKVLSIPKLVLLGFFLAVMYMTNAWDGAIYLLLTGLVLLALHGKKLSDYKTKLDWAIPLLTSFIISTISFGIFTIPYSIFFKPFVSGIGILCAPDFLVKMGKLGPFLFEANHCQHSYWWELLMLYGFFYFFVLSFVFISMRNKKHFTTDVFVFLLIILSTVLIILPEFIYMKDIYPAHFRANTMFKLVFQAFIMLSISSAYIIGRLLFRIQGEKRSLYQYAIFPILTIVLVSLVMTYPYLAIKAYYSDLKNYKGLDGIQYLKAQYPTDYEAIVWLNKMIKGQPVILEAQGDSYTDYARVSANTGLPTVLGWTVHEWLWRGSYDLPSELPKNISPEQLKKLKMYYPAPRIEEVKTLYETHDVPTTKMLLKKYKVRYVFIGAMEMQKYPNLDEAKFAKLGALVFQSGYTKIYQIPSF